MTACAVPHAAKDNAAAAAAALGSSLRMRQIIARPPRGNAGLMTIRRRARQTERHHIRFPASIVDTTAEHRYAGDNGPVLDGSWTLVTISAKGRREFQSAGE